MMVPLQVPSSFIPTSPLVPQGRLLIRKEQEATLKGFKIGEVLHSAYFDLEFPTIANAGREFSQECSV